MIYSDEWLGLVTPQRRDEPPRLSPLQRGHHVPIQSPAASSSPWSSFSAGATGTASPAGRRFWGRGPGTGVGWPSPCREGRCLDRSGGSCIVGGRAAGVEHRFARRRFPGVAGPSRQRRRCPQLGRRHGGCAVCGTRFRDHHLGDPERPVVLPSLGAQQLRSDRWRGRCRHGRRGSVGCDLRLEVGRRRSDRHRHRLQPSGSCVQHLAKSRRDRR